MVAPRKNALRRGDARAAVRAQRLQPDVQQAVGAAALDGCIRPGLLAQSLAEQRSPGQKILAFAAETAPDMHALLPLAHAKLARKKADLLAGNLVNAADSGFGSPTNSMAVVDAKGREEIWPNQSKADVAWELCSWLLRM